MLIYRVLLLVFAVSLAGFCNAQDRILMMNGKVIEANVLGSEGDDYTYQVKKKSGKAKEKTVSRYRVFSIVYADGREDMLYEQDTLIGNYFSPEEMRWYILGSNAAAKDFKVPAAALASFAVSGAAGFAMGDNFFVIAVPFLVTVGAGSLPTKVRNKKFDNPEYLANPAFVLGYQQKARSRKLSRGLIASLLGLAAGEALYFATVSD